MQIQNFSVAASQQSVQEEAAVKVAKMGLDSIKTEGSDLAKLLNTLPPVKDPAAGNNVDFLA
ncbi:MAG: hypothetical protein Ta2F_00750 [Termitinemataceae bacterium]|nr:MAG: hypothetical protein Ta2F_00750 [Termitinemataceae bacterium]